MFSQNENFEVHNYLTNNGYSEAYSLIKNILISSIYKKLSIQSISLIISKSLREYNEKLFKYLITYYILSKLNISDHKEETCSILIISIQHNMILSKP